MQPINAVKSMIYVGNKLRKTYLIVSLFGACIHTIHLVPLTVMTSLKLVLIAHAFVIKQLLNASLAIVKQVMIQILKIGKVAVTSQAFNVHQFGRILLVIQGEVN
jgi:hypothetical protein